MHDPHAVNTVIETPDASAIEGRVAWDPVWSLWNGGMMAATLVLGPLTLTPSAALVFVISTGATLLLGHSVGFHRRLIHGSFECPQWLEHVLVWWGVQVGMCGPLGIIRTHDLRDWAQRQPACHPYLSHANSMAKDGWWQLHCRLKLDNPPQFDLGSAGRNRLYRFLEATWMAQQVPTALLLWWAGGWSFVVWGLCARTFACVHGHWLVGYLAHNRGPQHWIVDGAGVQAHDVPWAGLITMGEAWHNNHHAFPGSARIGLCPEQSDLGYVFIRLLVKLGLAWDVRTPETLPVRSELLDWGQC
ncbi:MAG: acyl-CoA desaturase [Sphingomonas sp.]|uniref:acyl-CoA desaturase n=1 Tax=Sphingomonas sp. TaxID=28214 RepID=UPI001B209A06|nr:acyl-CoA desaturase [Sphingomonas sp.]MBO9624670.1 acyl-CoA desaturase [Sphingomonas sp.]